MTIDLNPTSDQRQIVDSVRDVLNDRFPLARFRDARPGGEHDNAAYAEAAQLGWLGLGLDDSAGGAGFTLVEDVFLFRELGRHLVTPKVLAGSIGAHLASALGRDDLAGAFVDGSAIAAVGGRLTAPGAAHTHAIYDGEGAGHVLLWNDDEIRLVARDGFAGEEATQCLDRTVSQTRAVLKTGGDLVLAGKAAAAIVRRADLLVAAQLLGLAEAALDLAVDYAKIREQFGQPIGAFQAIKHRCADMKVRTKILESLVTMAGLSEFEGRADAPAQIAGAGLLARRYALDNAAAGIQIHGAMGFTAECDAHLFLLRAHLLREFGATVPEREVAFVGMPPTRAKKG